jgi:origin recognition complex subunit 1
VGFDESPIESIKTKATILTESAFTARYPSKKIPRKAKEEYGKTFICRRGCNLGTTTYTEEFNWEHIKHTTEEDVLELWERLKSETKSRRGRKPGQKVAKRKREDYISDVEAGDNYHDDVIETPRKKNKHSTVSTPRKPRTPSKLLTPSHKR